MDFDSPKYLMFQDDFKLNHEPKLDAREVSDKDVPIWNFQNGQSPKEWGSRDTKVVAVI